MIMHSIKFGEACYNKMRMMYVDLASMKSKKEFGFNSYLRTQSRRLADEQNKLKNWFSF